VNIKDSAGEIDGKCGPARRSPINGQGSAPEGTITEESFSERTINLACTSVEHFVEKSDGSKERVTVKLTVLQEVVDGVTTFFCVGAHKSMIDAVYPAQETERLCIVGTQVTDRADRCKKVKPCPPLKFTPVPTNLMCGPILPPDQALMYSWLTTRLGSDTAPRELDETSQRWRTCTSHCAQLFFKNGECQRLTPLLGSGGINYDVIDFTNGAGIYSDILPKPKSPPLSESSSVASSLDSLGSGGSFDDDELDEDDGEEEDGGEEADFERQSHNSFEEEAGGVRRLREAIALTADAKIPLADVLALISSCMAGPKFFNPSTFVKKTPEGFRFYPYLEEALVDGLIDLPYMTPEYPTKHIPLGLSRVVEKSLREVLNGKRGGSLAEGQSKAVIAAMFRPGFSCVKVKPAGEELTLEEFSAGLKSCATSHSSMGNSKNCRYWAKMILEKPAGTLEQCAKVCDDDFSWKQTLKSWAKPSVPRY